MTLFSYEKTEGNRSSELSGTKKNGENNIMIVGTGAPIFSVLVVPVEK